MCCSVRRRLGLVAGIVALGWLVGCRIDALLHPSAATGAPDARLTFAPPPNGTVDQPLSPPVRVTAVDSAGRADTTFQLPVTLTLDANPGRATLAGTRTVAAVRGVATFSDLSLNQPGTGYTLLATAPGVQGVTSPPFDVTAPPPPTGNLTVSTSTSGGTPDPNGYTFTVDGGASQPIGINETITLTGVSTGSHTVVLSGIASNCTVSGGTSRTVTVTAGGTGTASFTIRCPTPPPPPGTLPLTTSTSGLPPPPNGYTFTVDGGASQPIGADATVPLSGASTRSHTIVS